MCLDNYAPQMIYEKTAELAEEAAEFLDRPVIDVMHDAIVGLHHEIAGSDYAPGDEPAYLKIVLENERMRVALNFFHDFFTVDASMAVLVDASMAVLGAGLRSHLLARVQEGLGG